jgi:protein TonB
MLARLVESGRRPKRSARGMLVSVLFHFVVVSAAVVGTTRGEQVPRDQAGDDQIHFARPLPEVPTPSTGSAGQPSEGPGRPVPLPPVLPGPVSVDVPPIVGVRPVLSNVGPGMADLLDALSSGNAAGVAHGVPGASGEHAWDAVMVEEQVVPSRRNPAPVYPSMERAAGITGEVVARFVVDTTGRVEPGSAEVLAQTSPSFGTAVLNVLPRYRFTPARVQGRAVRQLVEQRFVFTLD